MYEYNTQQEREALSKIYVEEEVIKAIIELNKFVARTSRDMGVDVEDLIRYRDEVVRSKFGIY